MARSTTGNWLSRLVSLIPPPKVPVEAGSPEARTAIEKSLHLTLPDDFYELASLYGSGEFRTDEYSLVLGIYNPYSRWFDRVIHKSAKSFKGFWPSYEMHPASPGLFICGTG